ncbi:hypothetical protein D3C86_1454960 [compost metagenome]
MLGGADHADGFVQHEVACGLAGLQHLSIEFDAAEDAHLVAAVATDLAIHTHAATGE